MAEVKIVNVKKVDATPCAYMATINCPHCYRPVDVFWSNDEEESGKVLKEECTYCAGEIQFKIEGDNNVKSDN